MRNPPLQKDRCSVSLSVPRLQLAWRGWKREPPRAPTAPLISPQPPTSTAAGLSYRRRLIGAPRWTALGRRRRGGRLGWPPRASRGWRLGGRAAWAGGPSPALPVFLPAIRGSVPWNSSWEGEALFCVASSGPRPPLLFHPPRPPPRPARSSLGLPSVRGGSTRSGRLDPAVAAPTAQYHQPATAATVQDSTQSPLTRGHVGSAPHRRQSVKTPRPRPPTAAAAIVVAAVGDAADKKASPCGMEPVKTKVEHQTHPPPPPPFARPDCCSIWASPLVVPDIDTAQIFQVPLPPRPLLPQFETAVRWGPHDISQSAPRCCFAPLSMFQGVQLGPVSYLRFVPLLFVSCLCHLPTVSIFLSTRNRRRLDPTLFRAASPVWLVVGM